MIFDRVTRLFVFVCCCCLSFFFFFLFVCFVVIVVVFVLLLFYCLVFVQCIFYPHYSCFGEGLKSKKISNDQELIQSDPISCPQNQKGNN